jgi:hypothetical protein
VLRIKFSAERKFSAPKSASSPSAKTLWAIKTLYMEDKPWTKYWIKSFMKDQQHGQKRFKRLDKGYPPFEIDEALIDIVEFDEFIQIEERRVPLLIGSQFGIYPRIDDIPQFFNGEKLIAILGKSLLSGHIAGLSLYQIGKNEKKFKFNKIGYYENK